jgi:hypothetical protein
VTDATPRDEYLRRRRIARIATLTAALIAAYLVTDIIQLSSEGTNPYALIPWLVLVMHLVASTIFLWKVWGWVRRARPEPVMEPGADEVEHRRHQIFSGEVEPPRRW